MYPAVIASAGIVKHSIMRTISVLCVIAVLALIGLGIKRILYPKATESYAQKAETIQNYEYHNYYDGDAKFFFGLKLFGFKLGISKLEVKKEGRNE